MVIRIVKLFRSLKVSFVLILWLFFLFPFPYIHGFIDVALYHVNAMQARNLRPANCAMRGVDRSEWLASKRAIGWTKPQKEKENFWGGAVRVCSFLCSLLHAFSFPNPVKREDRNDLPLETVVNCIVRNCINGINGGRQLSICYNLLLTYIVPVISCL